MFEIILNDKKSKYREKPVMDIDVEDPCSWEELKDKPVIPENVGHIEQRLSGVELRVESIESEMKNDTTLADAKSYVDGKLKNISYIKSSSIPTSGWATKTGYYEINITVSGLDVTNASVIIDADTSGITDINTITNIDESWSKVVKIVASTNKLYVAATEIPSVAIPLKILVVRYTT